MRDADCFEELINYIFVDFLAGFANAMTTVAEELRGFGERGIHRLIMLLKQQITQWNSSSSAAFCRSEGRSKNTIREYYNNFDIFLKRYSNDSSDVYFRQFF